MKLFRSDVRLTPSWDFLNKSIALLKANPWPAIYLTLLPSLIVIVGVVLLQHAVNQVTGDVTVDGKFYSGLGLVIIGGIWTLLTYPGAIKYQLDAVRGGASTPSVYYKSGLRRVLPLLGLQILLSVLIVFGFIALIIPGIILIRGLYLAQYHMIDQNLSPIEAIKKSYRTSQPHAGYIWGTIGVGIVFSLIGSTLGQIPVIGYIISLAASLPYYFGAALRYNEIKQLPISAADSPANV